MSNREKTLRRLGVALCAGVGGLIAALSCGGDSTGPNGVACAGQQTVRLHFVNITNTPGLQVSATYQTSSGLKSCGPVDLPVQDPDGGLELAQLLIEGAVGSVITVSATSGVAVAVAACRITAEAEPQPGQTEFQTFALVFGGLPLQVTCDNGLEPVTP
jgi:hypothetical protein